VSAERVFPERLFGVCLQDTHERPFAVKPLIEQPSAERVFATAGGVRYCPEHLYGTWRPDG
jgi:hypothetical protein